ncbi:MAG: HAD family hydrolase [Planctomycetota bacterium]|nr:HAD family hydrolase [Planctomycetota bacterium]
MLYDAVMFDLDGTLADTLADIAAAANHALAQLGRPTFPVPRFRYLAGQGLESLMVEALGPDHRGLLEQGMAHFRSYYAQHSMDQTGPYEGIAELLDTLMVPTPVGRGPKLAVLSNKPHPATIKLIEDAFAAWRFDAVRGHIEGTPLKPDPTSALEVAASLGVPPARWLYVGDTRVDMLTAVGAGMCPVGVLWGFRDELELREAGARHIVKHPSEILGLLG